MTPVRCHDEKRRGLEYRPVALFDEVLAEGEWRPHWFATWREKRP
jgi:hypothetical protein